MLEYVCNDLDFLTIIEGDLKLGRLSGVLGLGRADDEINSSIITNKKKKKKKEERILIKIVRFFLSRSDIFEVPANRLSSIFLLLNIKKDSPLAGVKKIIYATQTHSSSLLRTPMTPGLLGL